MRRYRHKKRVTAVAISNQTYIDLAVERWGGVAKNWKLETVKRKVQEEGLI